MDEPLEWPYGVHEESVNGVLRDLRKTHAFAKQEQTWDAGGSCAGVGAEKFSPYGHYHYPKG